jgi:DNA-binding winged helix-turn-helix (wHTH) protein/tetratricopeptide (TPR) repeat protein
MGLRNSHIFEFADFRLVPGEGLLLRGEQPIPLSIKAFATLVMLVERHGHLVERSVMLDEIWGEAFVEEAAVSRCVWSVRSALGDTKERFIQTIPRRGYRFICPVSVITDRSGAYRSSDLSGTVKTDDAASRQSATNGVEFTNSLLIQETLPEEPLRFRMLRSWATYAVAGIILLMGVSLYAYLNRPRIRSLNPSGPLGTANEEASRLYLQAENLSARRNQENMPTAMDYLNQAVELDPNFARAWAAKAHLHRYVAEYPGGDQTEQYKRSMDALGKALAIDPNLSDAHSALCLNKLRYEYDSAGAESECIQALNLDPDSSIGHKAYATFLFSHGRFEEAIAEIKKAIDLQPLALEHQQTYALALYYAGRYEEEEAQWKRLMELNPTHGFIYTRLFMNQKQQGKDDKAFDYLHKKLVIDRVDNQIIESFRTAYAASGWRGVTIERIKHPEIESFTGPFDIACLYATIGDKDMAFEYLEKAYLERSYRIAVLHVEPQLAPLRDDPRYADLVRRVEAQN